MEKIIILVLVMLLALSIGASIQIRNLDCKEFKDVSIQTLPVRCLEYYNIKK